MFENCEVFKADSLRNQQQAKTEHKDYNKKGESTQF